MTNNLTNPFDVSIFPFKHFNFHEAVFPTDTVNFRL